MLLRVRFAPSPTGYLHIGGARTALFNWLWARKMNGIFVLRIEDTDRERSTEESRRVILESLEWLGLDWDEGPIAQTDRLPLYREFAERLIRDEKAFRCFCTQEELAAQRAELLARDPKAQFKYPGTCRDRKDEPDLPHVVRFIAPREGAIRYVDKVFGEVITPNIENQDFVLLRSDGIPLYNFGAVVDDITMDITLVARGRDHMVNTPPQILLYGALGRELPEFAHLPMMLAPNGQKLGKRHGAVSVTQYRDQGYTPDAVLNYLARFGWSHGDEEVFSKAQLIEAFSWEACGRADGKFDAKKFQAINHEHLKEPSLLSDSQYARQLAPFLEARGVNVEADAVEGALFAIRERARTFVEAAEMLAFLREDLAIDPEVAREQLTAENAPRLSALRAVLAGASAWTEAELEAKVAAHLAETGAKMKGVAQPARVALTGQRASPGLFQVMRVLGRDRTLARLDEAIAIAAR